MKSVVVIEDDAAVAASVAALLSSWGYACTGYATGEAFLTADAPRPDCILLDIRLPGMDGMSLLDTYRASDPTTPVIVMTGHGDVRMAVDAMRRGAQDFIEKPFDGEDLVRRIQAALDRAEPDLDCRRRLDDLTPRETDVLRQIVDGHPNKVIAYRLGISQKTVELHRSRVMHKTGAKSVSELVRIALRGGVSPSLG